MSNETGHWITREVEKIIADLREEVASQKGCVTQYAFQAIGFAAVIWGLALKQDTIGNGVAIQFCGTLVVFMLLMVVRMANHKYSTMNRNLGYELHLHRVRDYAKVGNVNLARRMLEIGWEEAMCAWRVVQPTIYECPYHSASNFLRPHRARTGHRAEDRDYRWYDTKALIFSDAVYHPGNYLRNIHWILNAVALFSIFVMVYFYLKMFWGKFFGPWTGSQVVGAGCIFLILGYWFTQWRRHNSLRNLLESELLSIQSCAVVWRVIVICHILAVALAMRRNRSYKYYTTYSALLALDFNQSFYTPHEWMAKWEALMDSDEVFVELDKVIPPDSIFVKFKKRKKNGTGYFTL